MGLGCGSPPPLAAPEPNGSLRCRRPASPRQTSQPHESLQPQAMRRPHAARRKRERQTRPLSAIPASTAPYRSGRTPPESELSCARTGPLHARRSSLLHPRRRGRPLQAHGCSGTPRRPAVVCILLSAQPLLGRRPSSGQQSLLLCGHPQHTKQLSSHPGPADHSAHLKTTAATRAAQRVYPERGLEQPYGPSLWSGFRPRRSAPPQALRAGCGWCHRTTGS